MVDFAAARLNMVESQIRTNKVSDEAILTAFEDLPRERFVPENKQGIAYIDEDLPIGHGRYLIEPMVLARLLQAAAPRAGEMVLDVGCGSGFSTAIMAQLGATVVGLESELELVESANALLTELDIDNGVVVRGTLEEGYGKQAPYDVILIGGSVEFVPEAVTDQLAEGGRLATVVRAPNGGLGQAMLYRRDGGVVAHRALFDASIPALPGFAKKRGFTF